MELLPRSVARARAHARRFPRPFWLLIGANAVGSLGAGLFVPYWALYLTGSLGASGLEAGGLVAIAILTPFWAIMSDLSSPAISAAIADVVEPDLRTEAYGLRRQAGNVAFALGPPLGA